jgi:adenylylsulfate kinase
MILQLCGLSGAGKTTLALNVKKKLLREGMKVEIIDGDEYRKTLCRDLGFSREERLENIRRLGFVASRLSAHGIICIISAINPYHEQRDEIRAMYKNVKTIYLGCPLETLISRDTKGLYKKALLPEGHPEKIMNLTGINDRFDVPENPDLYINTGMKEIEESALEFFNFIMEHRHRPAKQKMYRYAQIFFPFIQVLFVIEKTCR